MLNILIIGNGFDLYHKLPTRYNDFMFLATEWEMFYASYESSSYNITSTSTKISVPLTDRGEMTQEALTEFGKHRSLMNEKHIDYLKKNLQSNAWIQYFRLLELGGLRWVDFENEIKKALSFTEEYFTYIIPKCGKSIENYNMFNLQEAATKIIPTIAVPLTTISSLPSYIQNLEYIFGWAVDTETLPEDLYNKDNYKKKRRLYNSYEKYRKEMTSKGLTIDKTDLQNKKERFIEAMLRELQKLITCLDYYLTDFVGILMPIGHSEQLKRLGSVCVLSFNYTNNFGKIYGKSNCLEYHSVHGEIGKKDSIVLGISDDEFQETLEYIRFQKYFQRIQKHTGSLYKQWLERAERELPEEFTRHVYIMGHSLGVVDFGILNDFFEKKCVEKITIFYYHQKAYESLVINLVDALGKEKVIEQIGCGRIEFEELQAPV